MQLSRQKDDKGRERRKFDRTACDIPVAVQINFWGPKNTFVDSGVIENFSEGGVLIAVPRHEDINVKWPDEFSLMRLYVGAGGADSMSRVIDCEPCRVHGEGEDIRLGATFMQHGLEMAGLLHDRTV